MKVINNSLEEFRCEGEKGTRRWLKQNARSKVSSEDVKFGIICLWLGRMTLTVEFMG